MDQEEDFNHQPPSEPVSPDSIFDAELFTAAESFDRKLKEKYPPEKYRKLKTIGAFIANGSTIDDACVLALIDPENLKAIMKGDQYVRAFIRHKQISHKAKLLKTISQAGFHGNVKAAGYLLEQQHRDEYGKKRDDDDTRDPDMVQRAIEAVREKGDARPLTSLPASFQTPKTAPYREITP